MAAKKKAISFEKTAKDMKQDKKTGLKEGSRREEAMDRKMMKAGKKGMKGC